MRQQVQCQGLLYRLQGSGALLGDYWELRVYQQHGFESYNANNNEIKGVKGYCNINFRGIAECRLDFSGYDRYQAMGITLQRGTICRGLGYDRGLHV